jgi:ribonuclease P protein component
MGLKASRVGSERLREVLASGQPARTRLFSGKALPAKVFRFSVVAPSKAFPAANLRNRARRRCREALREAAVSPAPKVDLIVTARREVLGVDFRSLVAEAQEILKCYSKNL